MSASSDIRSYIRGIVGENATSILCTVVSLDETEMTCEVEPIAEGTNFLDVRLMADPSTTGIYFKPSIGSIVMISPQDEVTYFVSMYSSIDEIWLRGNANGGLIKVAELITKLNNLENLVNDLITKFNTHTHILALTAGTGTAAPTVTLETGMLTPTIDSDIQSNTVKHG